MASNPKVQPVVNQIEVHPFNTQTGIRETCAKHNIFVEAYAPLARAMRMRHPGLVALSKAYSCTPAQLLVRWVVFSMVAGRWKLADRFRWGLQHNMVTLPKSVKKQRLLENVNINGFEISKEDMAAMDAFDEGLVTDW